MMTGSRYIGKDTSNNCLEPGGRLSIKIASYQCKDPHAKD